MATQTFPPVPPQDWPPRSTYVAPPAFGDESTAPLENQAILLTGETHFQALPIGIDALTEQPQQPSGSPPEDTTATEGPGGVTYT